MGKIRTEEQWRSIFAEWESSGEAGRAWCVKNDIKYSTFRSWYRNLYPMVNEPTETVGTQGEVSSQWVEAVGAANPPSQEKTSAVTITMGAFTVTAEKGFDEETLAGVFRALKSS